MSEQKPRLSPRKAVIAVAGIILLGTFDLRFVDALVVNPWALSLTGGPTLTGRWSGALRLPSGEVRRLDLVIEHSMAARCTDCDIAGTFRVCRNGVLDRTYRIHGDNDTWRGSTFHVTLMPDTDFRPGELRLGRLDGQWSGNVVRIRARWWRHSQSATTAETREGGIPAAPPPLVFELRKDEPTAC